jgi:hypothetical protein
LCNNLNYKGVKQDAIDLMLGNYRPDSSGPSPFTPRTGQESLSNNVTKVFVLLIIIFSTLLLASPLTPTSSNNSMFSMSESDKLNTSMLLSMMITSVVVMYILYSVVKVGSKIGKKIVVHPQLMPDAPV